MKNNQSPIRRDNDNVITRRVYQSRVYRQNMRIYFHPLRVYRDSKISRIIII